MLPGEISGRLLENLGEGVLLLIGFEGPPSQLSRRIIKVPVAVIDMNFRRVN